MATQKKEANPKKVTIYGRLSFPAFTTDAAFAFSQKGAYPSASPEKSKPNFQLIVEEPQLKKFRNHVENVFFPYVVQQHKEGKKADALDEKNVKMLEQSVDALGTGICNTPFKEVTDQVLETFPEAKGVLKFMGNEGNDITLKAIVRDEDELKVPDPDILSFPIILDINETTHEMYAGAYVAVTCSLYAYTQGKLPGFAAGANTAVFKQDGDRIGSSDAIDEDEIFSD